MIQFNQIIITFTEKILPFSLYFDIVKNVASVSKKCRNTVFPHCITLHFMRRGAFLVQFFFYSVWTRLVFPCADNQGDSSLLRCMDVQAVAMVTCSSAAAKSHSKMILVHITFSRWPTGQRSEQQVNVACQVQCLHTLRSKSFRSLEEHGHSLSAFNFLLKLDAWQIKIFQKDFWT